MVKKALGVTIVIVVILCLAVVGGLIYIMSNTTDTGKTAINNTMIMFNESQLQLREKCLSQCILDIEGTCEGKECREILDVRGD
ncbi:MAG: hypothetical protein KAR87_02370 [Candidatus Aenigmarchaeota archaeon]|nr:hypothetical protein [Candidatus Aenigmarchaeota archaeon]